MVRKHADANAKRTNRPTAKDEYCSGLPRTINCAQDGTERIIAREANRGSNALVRPVSR